MLERLILLRDIPFAYVSLSAMFDAGVDEFILVPRTSLRKLREKGFKITEISRADVFIGPYRILEVDSHDRKVFHGKLYRLFDRVDIDSSGSLYNFRKNKITLKDVDKTKNQ